MSGFRIAAWVLCGIVAVGGIAVSFYLDFRVWLDGIRGKPLPANIPKYLRKATASVVAACSAAYVALVVYDWRAIEFILLFVFFTALVWGATVVPLRHRLLYSMALAQRRVDKAHANDTPDNVEDVKTSNDSDSHSQGNR